MDNTPFNFVARKNEFIEYIINFVYNHLCKWRDVSIRPDEESEKQLNSDFPKFLTAHAHADEILINFFPEEPQGNGRTVDLAVCFDNVEYYNTVITVFECKRLSVDIKGDRKDEYVTGHKDITGGIQRFKLEKHGKNHKIVGMIGYIQTGKSSEWLGTINKCIGNLYDKIDENCLCWTKNEKLKTIENDEKNGRYHAKSIHPRITESHITIHHLWVDMQKN